MLHSVARWGEGKVRERKITVLFPSSSVAQRTAPPSRPAAVAQLIAKQSDDAVLSGPFGGELKVESYLASGYSRLVLTMETSSLTSSSASGGILVNCFGRQVIGLVQQVDPIERFVGFFQCDIHSRFQVAERRRAIAWDASPRFAQKFSL